MASHYTLTGDTALQEEGEEDQLVGEEEETLTDNEPPGSARGNAGFRPLSS